MKVLKHWVNIGAGKRTEEDYFCDRGDNDRQCWRHPSHIGSHTYERPTDKTEYAGAVEVIEIDVKIG